jgi:NarL family two-component system response regulator LiaR
MTPLRAVTEKIRVLVVDDHAMFREGMKLLLNRAARIDVVAEASAPEQALALAAVHQPHVILLDIDLEGFDGLEIVESLQATAPGAGIIVLTGVRTPELQAQALRLGARGFIPKEQSAELAVRAIERVHGGELWFDRRTLGAAVIDARGGTGHNPTDGGLTSREREVVRLVGEGLRNDEIAERLSISDKTVRNHLTVIFEKLAVSDRLHLAVYAYRHGLAKLPS